jgi:hypothetical protein
MASLKMTIPFFKKLSEVEQLYNVSDEVDLVFKENWGIDIHKNEIDPKTGKRKIKAYRPTKTGIEVHGAEDKVKYMQGPFGSGKSVIAVNDLLHLARAVPPWNKGVRASKAAFVRNTAGELKITTLPMWMDWYGDCGAFAKNEKPVMSYRHTFRFYDERTDEKGTIYIEIFFLPLDGDRVLGKIDSLNITFAYINEMRHLSDELLQRVIGRTDRYPSRDDCPDYRACVIADSNPPKIGHWIQSKFDLDRIKGWRRFGQPPGLIKDANGEWMDNPEHDTYPYISKEYYVNLSRGANEEFIKVYCLGEYGLAQDGKPVYQDYNDDIHSAPGLMIAKHVTVDFGWDFGLTPSCIISQQFSNGRVVVIKEFVSNDSGIRSFASNVVIPWLRANGLMGQGAPLFRHSTGDPAGNQKAQTDERTCFNILTELGIPTSGASTNSIVKRVENVRWFLNKLIDGKPAIIISREGCPVLREGFMIGYHYRKVRVAGGIDYKYQDEPEKNEYSHPHDALQYLLDRIAGRGYEAVRGDYSDFSHIVQGI